MTGWVDVSVMLYMLAVGYLCIKGILWWLVTGVGRWLFRRLSTVSLMRLARRGVFSGACLCLATGLLLLFEHTGWVVLQVLYIAIGAVSGFYLLCELVTLFGILRGDWNFSTPKLRLMDAVSAFLALKVCAVLVFGIFRWGWKFFLMMFPATTDWERKYDAYGGYWNYVSMVNAGNGKYYV